MTSSKDMKDSPGGRIGHICASDKGYMFVLGGYNGYDELMETNYLSTNELWIYDTLIEKWFMKWCGPETEPKDIPPQSSGATCCLIDGFLYVFGGYNEEGNSNQLFRLNLKTFKWKLMEPKGNKPIASDKSVCWEYDNKLFIFGGYGCPPNQFHKENNCKFVFDPKSDYSHYKRGWNNQLVYYDIELNQWLWPTVKGEVPIPRAAHAAAKVGDRVYIFGGRHKTIRMNDMFFIDMKRMKWFEVMDGLQTAVKPIGRSWHSLTTLSDTHLVLFGGFTQDNKPLGDCWIFDTHSKNWNVVDLPFHKPRLWHSACLSPYGEVVVFGGAKENILSFTNLVNLKDLYSGDLIILRFGTKSLLRLCLEATANNWLQSQQFWCYLPKNIKNLLELKKTSLTTDSVGS